MTRVGPPITPPIAEPELARAGAPAHAATQAAIQPALASTGAASAGVRAATSLAALARAEGLDPASLIANIRTSFGSLLEMAQTMREHHGALGDLLYCKDVSELLSPERQAMVAAENARIHAFDTELKAIKAAKRGASEAASALPQAEAEVLTKTAAARYLDALKNLADAYHETFLPTVRRNELMLALKNADFHAAVDYYEKTAQRWPAYANDDLGREYFVVANNKAAEKAVAALKKALSKGQPVEPAAIKNAASLLQRSIIEGKSYVVERAGDSLGKGRPHYLVITPDAMPNFKLASSEIVAGVGKAFYVLRDLIGLVDAVPGSASEATDFLRQQLIIECRDLDGRLPADFDMRRAALEVSTRYCESAYNGDFAYYPAMPSIYQNFELGNVARAEALLELAQVSCEMAGGKNSKDFWCLQSQLEVALMRRDHRTVIELLEVTLPLVTEGWHIDTCAMRMRTLADQRAANEGDDTTHVRMLRLIATEFAARANAIYSGTAEPQAEWNAKLIASARAITALDPIEPAPHVRAGRERSAFIRSNSFSFRALTTSHSPGARLVVGGNYAYGGQIPNTEVTRTTRRHGLDILARLRIDEHTSTSDAEEKIRTFIDSAYGFVRNNERVAESLTGPMHVNELDPFCKFRFSVTGAKARGDDATELFTDVQMGIGDCRPSNWAGGYLATLAQSARVSALLRAAYHALPATTGSLYCPLGTAARDITATLAAARRELQIDYRIMSWVIHANVAGKGPYDFETDSEGRYIPTPGDKLLEKEDHTAVTMLRVNDDDAAVEWTSKCFFYQWHYPLWNARLDLDALDALLPGQAAKARATSTNRKGESVPVMPMGTCMAGGPGGLSELLNSRGKPTSYALSIASYSGIVMRPHDPEKAASHAGVTFAGAEVAPANPSTLSYGDGSLNLLGNRRRQLALDIAKKGLAT